MSLERFQVLILPLLILTGLLFHPVFEPLSGSVPALFFGLTLISSMSIRKRDIRQLGRGFRPVLHLLAVNCLLLPALLYVLLHLFEFDRPLEQGIILAHIMPAGVTAVAWVAITKGNVGTTVSMITLSTALAPVTVPITLLLLSGDRVELAVSEMMGGLLKIVILPCMAGMILGNMAPLRDKAKQALSSLSKALLYAIVLINAASVSGVIGQVGSQIVPTVAVIALLIFCGYAASWIAVLLARADKPFEIAFTYSGGVRNYSAALVLVQLFLPPAAAVPVMIAMLLQHPAALLAHLLFAMRFRDPGVQQ